MCSNSISSEPFGDLARKPSEISGLAEEKIASSGHASKEWLETLQECSPVLLDTLGAQETVKRIIENCASPAQLALITEALTGDARASHAPADGWRELIRRVDHSPYTLAEWIAALEAFNQWLEREGLSAEFISILGYLDCCVEYIPAASGTFPFLKLVSTFLDEFGYDGSSASTSNLQERIEEG